MIENPVPILKEIRDLLHQILQELRYPVKGERHK